MYSKPKLTCLKGDIFVQVINGWETGTVEMGFISSQSKSLAGVR